MTDPQRPPSDAPAETPDEQVDQVGDDAQAMERSDRAIPLPDEREAQEGVGEVAGIVP